MEPALLDALFVDISEFGVGLPIDASGLQPNEEESEETTSATKWIQPVLVDIWYLDSLFVEISMAHQWAGTQKASGVETDSMESGTDSQQSQVIQDPYRVKPGPDTCCEAGYTAADFHCEDCSMVMCDDCVRDAMHDVNEIICRICRPSMAAGTSCDVKKKPAASPSSSVSMKRSVGGPGNAHIAKCAKRW